MRHGFIYPVLIVLVPVLLIGFEADMGTAALLTCASLIMLLVGGGNIRFFVVSGFISLAVLSFAVMMNSNRLQMFIAFLDLEAHKSGFGLQEWRAQLALGEGGVTGLGLG